MRRLATWSRQLVGILLVAAATRWALEALAAWWRAIPLVAVDAGTGDVLGWRVSPLTPAERLEAEARERSAHGFDIDPAGDLKSAPPASGDVPNRGAPPVDLFGGDMPAPHPTSADRPLRAPVEHPTDPDITARQLTWRGSVPMGSVPSEAVPAQGGLTLSATTSDSGADGSAGAARNRPGPRLAGEVTLSARPSRAAGLAAAAGALERVAGDLLRVAQTALEAGAELDEPDLTRAGGQLNVAAAELRDAVERLRDRARLAERLEELAPASPVGIPATGYGRELTPVADWPTPACPDCERTHPWRDHADVAPETELERRARDGDR
jgi:hypothetical protein